METLQHREAPKGHIHIIHNLEFLTMSERDSYMAKNEDLDKICLVRSPYCFYVLKSISPIEWKELGGVSQDDFKNGLDTKQGKLESGVNIKKINGVDILGAGEVSIKAEGEPIISNEKPKIDTNPKNAGTLWINLKEADIYICKDNTENLNVWESIKGKTIQFVTSIEIVKGQKIHDDFTSQCTKISDYEFLQNGVYIRGNNIAVPGFEIWKALDSAYDWSSATYATSWKSETEVLPNYIEIETPEKRKAVSVKFMQPNNAANCIKEMTIQGSNDKTNYVDLATAQLTQTYNVYQTINFNTSDYYKIYRVKITQKYGTGIGCASIQFIA